jgi:hypothetical protein
MWQADTESPGSDGASPYRLDPEDEHDDEDAMTMGLAELRALMQD